MNPQILFEDNQLLVIDKPAGMVVNRAQSVKGETVQDWIDKQRVLPLASPTAILPANKLGAPSVGPPGSRHPLNDFMRRSGIVHRIDKETSGVLIIAKTPEAFAELQRQFKSREVQKSYVALVHGKVVPPTGTIRAPVGRLPWNRERFGVLAGGREAQTEYRVLRIEERVVGRGKEYFSLMELYPKTGRTHQIRVHAKSINHPIVSDQFYAGRKTARSDRTWCPRLFLHAAKITFTHPTSGKRMTVEAALPKELVRALEALER